MTVVVVARSYRLRMTHKQWQRRNGTCNKCGAPVIETVDDYYVGGQVVGRDEPYASDVISARCSPGCLGPDDRDY